MSSNTDQASEKIAEDKRLLIDKEMVFQTGDAALDLLLESARKKFNDQNFKVRKEALDKLWDAFQRLKTIDYPLDKNKPVNKPKSTEKLISKSAREPEFRIRLNTEMNELTSIGDNFQIRHYEKGKTPIESSLQVDYLYYRMLSLILFLLNSRWKKVSLMLNYILENPEECVRFSSSLDQQGSFTCDRRDGRPRLSIIEYGEYGNSPIKKFHDMLPIGSFQPNKQVRSLGLDGNIHDVIRSQWGISGKDDLKLIVDFLEQYPLRKKLEKYISWKHMVDIYIKQGYKSPELLSLAEDFHKRF
jgi:hypothetical protein